MNLKHIELFRNADWPSIKPKLAAYSLGKVKSYSWRTTKDSLPKGFTPEDLVQKAVFDTFEGLLTEQTGVGLRKWDPTREPDLLEYLKGVVDSLVNNLVNSSEHKTTNYTARATKPEYVAATLQVAVDTSRHEEAPPAPATPEDLQEKAEDEARYKTLKRALLDEIENEDENETWVLIAMMELAESGEEITPTAIAAKTGLSKDEIKNIRKRIARRVENLRPKSLGKKG